MLLDCIVSVVAWLLLYVCMFSVVLKILWLYICDSKPSVVCLYVCD